MNTDLLKVRTVLTVRKMGRRLIPVAVCLESGVVGEQAQQAFDDWAAWVVARDAWRVRWHGTARRARAHARRELKEYFSVTLVAALADRILAAAEAGRGGLARGAPAVLCGWR